MQGRSRRITGPSAGASQVPPPACDLSAWHRWLPTERSLAPNPRDPGGLNATQTARLLRPWILPDSQSWVPTWHKPPQTSGSQELRQRRVSGVRHSRIQGVGPVTESFACALFPLLSDEGCLADDHRVGTQEVTVIAPWRCTTDVIKEFNPFGHPPKYGMARDPIYKIEKKL